MLPEAPVPSIKNYLMNSFSKHKIEYLSATGISFVQTAINLAIPFLFVKSCEIKEGEDDNRLPWLLGLCSAILVSNILAELRKEIITPIGSKLGNELGKTVVESYYALPMKRYISPANSSMVNYFGASILRISRAFVDGLHNEIIPSLLEMIGASILISARFGAVGGIVSGALAAQLLLLLAASPRMINAQNEYMKQMYGSMDEAINQVGQYAGVNIFNALKTQINRLTTVLKKFGQATDHIILIKSRVQLLSVLVQVASILGVGLFSINKKDQLTSNDMLWVLIYLRQIAPSFEKLSQAINDLLAEGEFFQGTVNYIREGYDYIDKSKPALHITEETATIQFQDVTFYYEGLKKPAIHHLTFAINPADFVVITGESGAGKTTLLSLLEKFYSPTEGIILFANMNIAAVSTESVRDALAVVPQDTLLLNMSLGENIAFANPNAIPSEIDEAIRFAGLASVRRKHGNKPLGINGGKLSAGQRLRVAIARAYIRKNAKYIFLDEPTAALDPQTEEDILLKLADLIKRKNLTAIFVTHRLAALKKVPNINKVLVMHHGRIIEEGTLAELSIMPDGYFANQMQVALAQEKLATISKERSSSLSEASVEEVELLSEFEVEMQSSSEHVVDMPGVAEGSRDPLISHTLPPVEQKSGICVIL